MNIGWPAAILGAALIFGVVAFVTSIVATRAAATDEAAKGKHADDYRKLAEQYEALTRQTREQQAAFQADLADLKAAVQSMERMMREVG